MYSYRLCGERLRSTVALPELGASSEVDPPAGADSDATWTCGPGAIPAATTVVHEWRRGDDLWLRISRCARGYRLAFTAGVTFLVDGRTIMWSADGSIPEDTLRHLLLDQALPLAMSGQGAWVLHGSAVLIGERAVLFVGDSGRGKSTLAAWLAEQGHPVLADDCLRLDEWEGDMVLTPAYPGLRLWPDSVQHVFAGKVDETHRVAHYTTKLRVSAVLPAAGPVPIDRVYLLNDAGGAEPVVRPATAASVVDVIRCTFRLDIDERRDLSRDFSRASRLVQRSMVRYLDVPRGLERLGDVTRAILADLAITADGAPGGRR